MQARQWRPAESSFLSYGLVVHSLLLPTLSSDSIIPSFNNAVTFGYGSESVYPEGTFTPLTKCAYRRTLNRFAVEFGPTIFCGHLGLRTVAMSR